MSVKVWPGNTKVEQPVFVHHGTDIHGNPGLFICDDTGRPVKSQCDGHSTVALWVGGRLVPQTGLSPSLAEHAGLVLNENNVLQVSY